MRTLLHAIAAVTEALQDPTAEISFNVDPGAGTSVSTSATPQKVKATFISLVNLFGEPFFDAMENPMENGFDSSAVWEFSDSEGGAYTLSDNPHSENLDEISSLRDSGADQDWIVGTSSGNIHSAEFAEWLTKKLQEN